MPVNRYNIRDIKDAEAALNSLNLEIQNKGFVQGTVDVYANLPSAATMDNGIIYIVRTDSPGKPNGLYVTENHIWIYFDGINLQNSDEVPNESTVTGTTVTDALDNLLPLSGGTLTGSITMSDNEITDILYAMFGQTTEPTLAADHGALYMKSDNKLYWKDGGGSEHEVPMGSFADYLPLAGGTMTGNIVMGGNDVTGAGNITLANAGTLDFNAGAGTTRMVYGTSGMDSFIWEINNIHAVEWTSGDMRFKTGADIQFLKGSVTHTELGAASLICTVQGSALGFYGDATFNNDVDMDDNPIDKAEFLGLQEITTPAALANYGKIYTKNDDKLYFQNGAGVEQEVAVGSLAYLPLAGGTMAGDITFDSTARYIRWGVDPTKSYAKYDGNGVAFWTNNTGTSRNILNISTSGIEVPEANALTARGNVMLGAVEIITDIDMGDKPVDKAQYLGLQEITTPGAVANYGKVYTKTDDKLYFQDGAGVEHEVNYDITIADYLPLAGGSLSGTLTFDDAVNIAVNATTGTKIGTATTQKLALWNATPVVQPAHVADASVAHGVTTFGQTVTALNALGQKINDILSLVIEAVGLTAVS